MDKLEVSGLGTKVDSSTITRQNLDGSGRRRDGVRQGGDG